MIRTCISPQDWSKTLVRILSTNVYAQAAVALVAAGVGFQQFRSQGCQISEQY
jgi:hypothetical protein